MKASILQLAWAGRLLILLALLSVLVLGVAAVSVGLKVSKGAGKGENAATRQAATNLQGKPALDYSKEHRIYDRLSSSTASAAYDIDRAPRAGLPRTLRQRGSGEVYTASNSAQNLNAYFTPDQVLLQPLRGDCRGGVQASLQLQDYGYGERMFNAGPGSMRVDGDRVEISRQLRGQPATSDNDEPTSHGKITEWYLNTKQGLEQGFTLDGPPGKRLGDAPLRLRIRVTGKVSLTAVDSGKGVELKSESDEVWLHYDHLGVTDARGRELPAKFEAGGQEITLVVDDADAVYPVQIDPLFTQTKKIAPGDGVAGDLFGISISISGDTVVVGANGNNSFMGAAYIFGRNQGGTGNWGQVKKLTGGDAAMGDQFGESVSISGDTLVVGARDKNSGTGAAYIFGRNQAGAENWGQVKKLTAGDAATSDSFGESVSISGDTVVVGARSKNSGTGAAYIFGRNQGGADNWGQVKKLTAGDAATGDLFGQSVWSSGDVVVVGAYGKDSYTGAVYVFGRNQGGTDNWGQVKKLTAVDAATFDNFGYSVSITGDTVIVGAYFKNSGTGAAYVFGRNQGGADNWGQVKKLTAGDAAGGDQFGYSVSITGDTAVLGARIKNSNTGATYIFGRNQGGADNWGEVQKLTAGDAATNDSFGESVSISGDTVVVGAYGKNSSTGAAYIFDLIFPPTITKLFGASSIPFNGSTSLSFTITNPNTSRPLTGVSFIDNLPSGLVVRSPNGLTNTCGGSAAAVAGSSSVSLAGGSLSPGGPCTLLVDVTGTNLGLKNNTTDNVTSTEGGAGGTASASITVAMANQTITVGTHAPASATFNTGFTVAATSTSGLAVSYSSAGVCTNSGATFTMTASTGTCTVRYDQAGNSNYNAATQVTESVTAQTATATAVSSGPNPSNSGSTVTFMAKVTSDTGATPTGTVQFKDGGVNIGSPQPLNSSGQASFETSSLVVGIHVITANYSGAASFAPSSGTLSGGQKVGSIVELDSSNYSVNESDNTVTIKVKRSGVQGNLVTVAYATDDTGASTSCATTNGKASSRCDFTTTLGTVSFVAGEFQKFVTIPITRDSYNEGPESFTLVFSSLHSGAAGAAFVGPTTATITINDSAPPAPNAIDDVTNFVRQHYHDFLNREPDQAGLDFWTNQITSCGSDAQCAEVRRINVSASFFLSIEFQDTGYFVERIYKTAYGDASETSTFPSAHTLSVPIVRPNEFLADAQKIGEAVVVGQGSWQRQLEDNKRFFSEAFVQRSRFTALYGSLSNAPFVDRLNNNAGNPLSASERNQLVSDLNSGAKTQAQVLQAITEHPNLAASEFNRAFVLMQYFGYLRRSPNDPQDSDYTGYDFWLTKLNQFNGNYINAEMVKAFITSIEYRQRFGP